MMRENQHGPYDVGPFQDITAWRFGCSTGEDWVEIAAEDFHPAGHNNVKIFPYEIGGKQYLYIYKATQYNFGCYRYDYSTGGISTIFTDPSVSPFTPATSRTGYTAFFQAATSNGKDTTYFIGQYQPASWGTPEYEMSYYLIAHDVKTGAITASLLHEDPTSAWTLYITSCTYANGKIYFMRKNYGGGNNTIAGIVDVSSSGWSAGSNIMLPIGSDNYRFNSVYGETSIYVDGKVYFVGGEHYRNGPSYGYRSYRHVIDIYDVATDTWTYFSPSSIHLGNWCSSVHFKTGENNIMFFTGLGGWPNDPGFPGITTNAAKYIIGGSSSTGKALPPPIDENAYRHISWGASKCLTVIYRNYVTDKDHIVNMSPGLF